MRKLLKLNFLIPVALLPIYFYRICLKPFLPQSCAFFPTCSQFAIEAIKKHGPIKGWWLALKRLWRCRPFSKNNFGFDPVP